MEKIISGIQQVGIGIPDVHEAWTWYRKHFGMDIPVFEEAAVSALMLPYTGGKVHERHAILAINMKGGGGFEIWQYTSRKPVPASFEIKLGDLGIFAAKIKTTDVLKTYEFLKEKNASLFSAPIADPAGELTFFVKDPYGNIFQIIRSSSWFTNSGRSLTGGPSGAMIGVRNMDTSIKFYHDILGYDSIVYDKTGTFNDLENLPGGKSILRRVRVRNSGTRKGSFSKLLGTDEIELISTEEREPVKIFKDRFWGDLGFIHLCYDVKGMDAIKKDCEKRGYPFTVDSAGSFDMGEAAGRFAYIEDPDGTLIEFVETHKIPILKKLGWYLNVKDRDPQKPLPDWMLRLLGLTRKRD